MSSSLSSFDAGPQLTLALSSPPFVFEPNTNWHAFLVGWITGWAKAAAVDNLNTRLRLVVGEQLITTVALVHRRAHLLYHVRVWLGTILRAKRLAKCLRATYARIMLRSRLECLFFGIRMWKAVVTNSNLNLSWSWRGRFMEAYPVMVIFQKVDRPREDGMLHKVFKCRLFGGLNTQIAHSLLNQHEGQLVRRLNADRRKGLPLHACASRT